MAEHPITPPDELVQQWASESLATQHLCTQAARWGADQELEACCRLLDSAAIIPPDGGKTLPENRLAARKRIIKLRAARRPKPPSLKEQALARLTSLEELAESMGHSPDDTIRRALEQLND